MMREELSCEVCGTKWHTFMNRPCPQCKPFVFVRFDDVRNGTFDWRTAQWFSREEAEAQGKKSMIEVIGESGRYAGVSVSMKVPTHPLKTEKRVLGG
jgi:hypothetical protein